MLLSEWVEKNGRGSLSRLSRETGLAYTTIFTALGGKIKRYDVAKKISDATNGAVSVADCCEPNGHAAKAVRPTRKTSARRRRSRAA